MKLSELLSREKCLRRQIAVLIAEQTGQSVRSHPTDAQMSAADDAIDTWSETVVMDNLYIPAPTPLQKLLVEHFGVCEMILDIRDEAVRRHVCKFEA